MPKFNFLNNCLHKTGVVPRAADPRQDCSQGTTMYWVWHSEGALSPWQQEHKTLLSFVSRELSCPCHGNRRSCLCTLANKVSLALLLALGLNNMVACLLVCAWDYNSKKAAVFSSGSNQAFGTPGGEELCSACTFISVDGQSPHMVTLLQYPWPNTESPSNAQAPVSAVGLCTIRRLPGFQYSSTYGTVTGLENTHVYKNSHIHGRVL